MSRSASGRWMRALAPAGLALLMTFAQPTPAHSNSETASAQEPDVRMTVTNLAQPGLESSDPQPPFELVTRGSCGTVFTAKQANSGRSKCRRGTWQPTGASAWEPALAFAFGDRIQLRFDQPMRRVRYSSTTDGPASLTPQYRRGWEDRQLLAPADAVATSDPHVWEILLPDPMETLITRTGATFSVVARDESRARAFAFSLRSPRPDRFGSSECVQAWYSPRDASTTCTPRGGMPLLAGVSVATGNARLNRAHVRVGIRTLHGAIARVSVLHRGRRVGRGRALMEPSRPQVVAVRLTRSFRSLLRRTKVASVRLTVRACYDICRAAIRTIRIRR